MEIKILDQFDNRLLKRIEYNAVIEHISEATPKRIEVRNKVAAMTNSDTDKTVVSVIMSEFGLGRSKLEFRIYDSTEMMKNIELPYLLKRNGHIEDKKD